MALEQSVLFIYVELDRRSPLRGRKRAQGADSKARRGVCLCPTLVAGRMS